MIRYILFTLLLISIIYLIYYLVSSVPKDTIHKKDIVADFTGITVKGLGEASKMGYPTINLDLLKDIDCGAYTVNTEYGPGIMFVFASQRSAEVHLLKSNPTIYRGITMKFNGLEKIIQKSKDGIIATFNNGCKRV